jgi:hypothetical protein
MEGGGELGRAVGRGAAACLGGGAVRLVVVVVVVVVKVVGSWLAIED